jgi:Ca2+-binding RTX toxin-like protein
MRAALVVIAAASVLVASAALTQGFDLGPPADLAAAVGQGPPAGSDDATCEVSGVHTSFRTAYDPEAPGTYRVDAVVVSDVDTSCAGAEVTVVLLDDGGSAIAVGTGTVGPSASVDVTTSPPPAASLVARVQVDVRGGTVPVPAPCGAFAPDRRLFGTVGDDDLAGTSLRDLVYGLAGADTIAGGPNPDCIDGGAGDDHLRGETGDDVLLGHAGADTIDGGNGRDQLHGGPGDDHLRGGTGNDLLDGGDGVDHCEGGGGKDTFVGCETRS